jgi:hypothetical protein
LERGAQPSCIVLWRKQAKPAVKALLKELLKELVPLINKTVLLVTNKTLQE